MIDDEKFMIIFIVDVNDQFNQWKRFLFRRFKSSFNLIFDVLFREQYTMRNAINRRESTKYAQKIFRLIKNVNLNNVKNQLNIIYNDIDNSLRKKNVKRSKNDDIVNDMLKILNDCKHDWWNYEIKTMREQKKSQSFKFTQNDQYEFNNKNNNQSNFQRRFFNQFKTNAYFNDQYNQRYQNRYFNYRFDYQNDDYDYQSNQYDDQNRYSNVDELSSSQQRLQITIEFNTTIINNAFSNESNSFMFNKRSSFRSRSNNQNDRDYQQRFNIIDRFVKT